jgi:amidase
MLQVLTGEDGIVDTVQGGVPGMRIGVADTWRTGHPATDELFEEAVQRLGPAGAEVVRVSPPAPPPSVEADEFMVLLCELKDSMDAYLPTRGPNGPQSLEEVIAHEDAYADVEQPWFGHDLFERAAESGGCRGDSYHSARRRNLAWAIQTCLEPVFATIDVLVAPTFGPAWKSDLILGGHPAQAAPTTTAPSIAGWPIATVPMGLVSGLPVGFGVIGRPGSEARLLAVGAAVESGARPAWLDPSRG